MSQNKADIYTILDNSYVECHDVIISYLQDDLKTLYSCIQVNRAFCRIFIPILWKNPYKFIEGEDRLIKIFNTLIHCLDSPIKKHLINEKLIRIEDLPAAPTAYFNYPTFIKDFELNPIQKGMRLWTSKYLMNPFNSGYSGQPLSGKKVSKRVIVINHYIGDLFFSKGNQYDSLNIYYSDLLSGPSSLLDICGINNHEKSLVNVKKLSLGFFHRNSTDLLPLITKNFLSLQNVLSPNIQHLQISIDTSKNHSEFSNNLINFIQIQHNLKSLIIDPFCKKGDFNHYITPLLGALQSQSKSLSFLSLKHFCITNRELASILRILPNLITLELDLKTFNPINILRMNILFNSINSNPINSQEISPLPTSLFNNLEHLNYLYRDKSDRLEYQNDSIFKQILLSSSNNLKSLEVKEIYCPLIIEVQQQCLLNLTHFHLIMKNSYPLDKLILLLKNLHQLIHLKLNSQNSNNYLMDQFKMFHTPTLSRYISITSNQNSTLNTSTQDDTSTISNQDITSNTSDQDANSTTSDTSDQDTDHITQLTNQFVHDLRLNNSMSNLTNSNRRFNRLDHMRFTRLISTSSNQNNLPNYDNSFKEFSQILPHSLKILEINFDIPERYLKILLQEPQLNFQCIKLYRQHYMEQLFEIFIDYQKRRKCFLELGLGRCGGIYFENHIKVAKKHFKVSTNINIDDLFYDVPIKNSPWSQKRYTEY